MKCKYCGSEVDGSGVDVTGYANQMKRIAERGDFDIEVSHSDADSILCEMLERLGYSEVVDLYHDVPKWYA